MRGKLPVAYESGIVGPDSVKGAKNMKRKYDANAISIRPLPIKGQRIDRVRGSEYRSTVRLYAVRDENLTAKGDWIVEVAEKQARKRQGQSRARLALKVFLAPGSATRHMTLLTRHSIIVLASEVARYRDRPHVHVTFRPVGAQGGKRTAKKAERELLPPWFLKHYKSRLRLRETVQGKVTSEHESGRRLGKFHDSKQVVVFRDWDEVEFIKLLFVMRVFAADQGFEY